MKYYIPLLNLFFQIQQPPVQTNPSCQREFILMPITLGQNQHKGTSTHQSRHLSMKVRVCCLHFQYYSTFISVLTALKYSRVVNVAKSKVLKYFIFLLLCSSCILMLASYLQGL